LKLPGRKDVKQPVRASVHEELRLRFLTGRITPGTPLSTRRIAQELGVSPMPVRDALGRLAADGAVDIRSKRRIVVPAMTAARHADLLSCRELLEPAAAAAALPQLGDAAVIQLERADQVVGDALISGNVEAYMRANYEFHFTIYRAQPHPTLVQLIETLWLQFGPYMRVVYEQYGGERLADQHTRAIRAIRRRRASELSAAILQDLRDGMSLLVRRGLEEDRP
jgi:DNA-binding GntR family transcriptional regulator